MFLFFFKKEQLCATVKQALERHSQQQAQQPITNIADLFPEVFRCSFKK